MINVSELSSEQIDALIKYMRFLKFCQEHGFLGKLLKSIFSWGLSISNKVTHRN